MLAKNFGMVSRRGAFTGTFILKMMPFTLGVILRACVMYCVIYNNACMYYVCCAWPPFQNNNSLIINTKHILTIT